MNVAIFDYGIDPINAIPKCNLLLTEAISPTCKVTVFSSWFSDPRTAGVRWVRVPSINRPLAALFVSFHLMAPILYLADRARHRSRFDHVQMVESNLSFGDVCYSHFCHRAYLKRHWQQSRPTGIRRISYWLNHSLHALAEPWVYRRAKWIIVPSQGLGREIIKEYSETRDKIHVIPNPIDVEKMERPKDLKRDEFRSRLGLSPEDIVLVFVAGGAFERKGLPLVLRAMSQLKTTHPKLLVVGGSPAIIDGYRLKATDAGVEKEVIFVGFERDVRPYLWAADAFAFPSFYEVFSLACLEAAAAGLPLLVTQLNGCEEFLHDGENGIVLERTPEGVAEGIMKFLAMSPQERQRMGQRARMDVQKYSVENFKAAWRTFYEKLDAA